MKRDEDRSHSVVIRCSYDAPPAITVCAAEKPQSTVTGISEAAARSSRLPRFIFIPLTRDPTLSLSPSLLSSWFECFHCNPAFALLQELITRITPFNGFSGFIIYTFFPALGWFRNFLGSNRVRLEQYVCLLHSFSWNSRNWTFRLIIKGYFPLLKWKLMYINSRS